MFVALNEFSSAGLRAKMLLKVVKVADPGLNVNVRFNIFICEEK